MSKSTNSTSAMTSVLDLSWSTHHKDLNAITMVARIRRQKETMQAKKALSSKEITAAATREITSKSRDFLPFDRKAIEQERLARLGKRKRDASPELPRKRSIEPTLPEHELSNSRAGYHDSWQLGESVDDFVKRLPPLTTSVLACEWLWVANPHPNPA